MWIYRQMLFISEIKAEFSASVSHDLQKSFTKHFQSMKKTFRGCIYLMKNTVNSNIITMFFIGMLHTWSYLSFALFPHFLDLFVQSSGCFLGKRKEGRWLLYMSIVIHSPALTWGSLTLFLSCAITSAMSQSSLYSPSRSPNSKSVLKSPALRPFRARFCLPNTMGCSWPHTQQLTLPPLPCALLWGFLW